MWKWIVGVVAAIIVLLVVTCYAGYRKLTDGGDTVVVSIRSGAGHVFAALTDADSMTAWMLPGTEISRTGRGALHPGDTVRITLPAGARTSAPRVAQLWVVREVRPPAVFVVDAIQFNTAGIPRVVNTRRDSVVTSGDSSGVMSTLVMATDPLGVSQPAGTQGAAVGVARKLMLGGARMMVQRQLEQLKKHLEGAGKPERR